MDYQYRYRGSEHPKRVRSVYSTIWIDQNKLPWPFSADVNGNGNLWKQGLPGNPIWCKSPHIAATFQKLLPQFCVNFPYCLPLTLSTCPCMSKAYPGPGSPVASHWLELEPVQTKIPPWSPLFFWRNPACITPRNAWRCSGKMVKAPIWAKLILNVVGNFQDTILVM